MTAESRYPWHEAAWRHLAVARQQQRVPHGILLGGMEGLGKSAFARRLGMSLVCPNPDTNGDACGCCDACRQVRAGSHPDLMLIVPEEAGKPIKIDAIRKLTARSALTAQPGGHRVIIIDPADAMNRSAANALLKTLEEPGSRTILVLVSARPDLLPATIRSRCQVIAIAAPDTAVARDWLAGQAANGDIDELLAISGGAPLRAIKAAAEDWLATDARLVADLEALKARRSNPLVVVEDWQKRPLPLVLDGMKRCLADMIRASIGVAGARVFHPALRARLQSLGQEIDLQGLYALHDEVLDLQRQSINNLNPQMMLEKLANAWLQLTRKGAR